MSVELFLFFLNSQIVLLSSMLFTPFRALGYVTIDVPFSLQSRGSTSYFLTTCINRSFQIYDVEKFNLLFVGPLAPGAITAIASLGDYTFAATGSLIIVYYRAKEVYRLTARDMDFEEVEGSPFTISQMTILGDLIFAICDDNVVRMWNHSTRGTILLCSNTSRISQ
jgi:U3 small nucleolar RNA-associated protein 21